MSDENKPHDGSHHDDAHGHDAPDATPPAQPETHAPPAVVEASPVEAAPAEHVHVEDDHASAEPVVPTTGTEAAEPVAAEPVVPGPVAPAEEKEDLSPILAAGAVGAAAAAAATRPAASSSDRPVIWSDQGDAPFDDGPDQGPVYARKSGGKGGRGKTRKPSGASELGEIIKTVVFALLIAMVLRIFLFQPFTIPSASMEPNLYHGDYIVVTKWSYGYSRHSMPFSPEIFQGRILDRAPQRGDIAVFKLPRDNRTDYIKRVIGLPGDRIQMINNSLFINGAQIPDVELTDVQIRGIESEAAAIHLRETLPSGRSYMIQDYGPLNQLDNTEVFEVPAGHYFMMGDNRDNSIDSRVLDGTGVGFVPAENLIGKAEIILFSWSPGASIRNPVSWFANLRPSRFFTVLK